MIWLLWKISDYESLYENNVYVNILIFCSNLALFYSGSKILICSLEKKYISTPSFFLKIYRGGKGS